MNHRFFRYDDPIHFEYFLEVFVHEMFHILGFSKELYPFFKKSNGEFYSYREMFYPIGDKVFLTLPTVKQVARDYY